VTRTGGNYVNCWLLTKLLQGYDNRSAEETAHTISSETVVPGAEIFIH
jgi:hypothetical protein